MPAKILVGTASWTDPGFIADWYPRALPASQRLGFYAEHFNLVEVNSSFYAVPAGAIVRRWCQETPRDFTFDVKLHRLFSRHSTDLKSLPPAVRPLAEVTGSKVRPTPKLQRALAAELLQALDPLLESGKFGAFLLQLTPGFSPHQNRLAELDAVLELFHPHLVAVELRNRNWMTGDAQQETLRYFADRKLTFVAVDAPEGEHFTTMPGIDAVTQPSLAYMRLHGRNLKGYVSGRTVAERFDYLYSDKELEQIRDRALKLAQEARQTHVVYNNNCSDYPLRNAATFQQLLAQEHSELLDLPPGRRASKPVRTMEFDFGPADAPDKA